MLKHIKLSSLIYPIIILILLLLLGCENKQVKQEKVNYQEQAAYDLSKDADIQRYNLDVMKQKARERSPCDTIAVVEFILNNYPSGTYLLNFDRTFTYNISKPALIYFTNTDGNKYVFAAIAASRPGERLIEPSNIIGYEQSFIDLDSTDLGTPFLYLVLFECSNQNLVIVWESPIPSLGGFNCIKLKTWQDKHIYYIENTFHYAQGFGHINYIYFIFNIIKNFPHLLMTYSGTSFKRTLADINNDNYPDYYEHIFYNLSDKVYSKDSVGFIWSVKDTVYINTRNKKQTRRY